MWRDSERTAAADGKVYVGGVGGTMAHLKAMEELD